MTDVAAPTTPAQAWAHKHGLVNMLRHGEARTTDNVLDRLLIQEAFYRYGIAHDEDRVDVLATLFTDDAVLEIAEGKQPFQRVEGAAALAANFASAIRQQTDQRRHCVTNVVFENLTETEALVIAYGIVTIAADGLTVGVAVIYTADFRKEADGVWRFSRLFIGMDVYSGKRLFGREA